MVRRGLGADLIAPPGQLVEIGSAAQPQTAAFRPLLVDRTRGTVGVERIESTSVWHPLANCCPLDEVRLPIGERVRLRVLVRAQYVEVYLDDRWLLASHFAEDMPSGSCGLFVADGHATFTNREAHVLRPLLASELKP